jgi:hypothetical protein
MGISGVRRLGSLCIGSAAVQALFSRRFAADSSHVSARFWRRASAIVRPYFSGNGVRTKPPLSQHVQQESSILHPAASHLTETKEYGDQK